jgi:hypothetical protein
MAITARASPSGVCRDAGSGDFGMAGGVEPEVCADEDPVAVHRERLDRLRDEFGDVAGGEGQAGGDLAGEQLAALGVEGEEQLLQGVEV